MKGHLHAYLLLIASLLFGLLSAQAQDPDPERIIIVDDDKGHPPYGTPVIPNPVSFDGCYQTDPVGTVQFMDDFLVYVGYDNFSDLYMTMHITDENGNLLALTHPLGTANPFTLDFDLINQDAVVPFAYHCVSSYCTLAFSMDYTVALPAGFPADDKIQIHYELEGLNYEGAYQLIYFDGFIETELCSPYMNGGNMRQGNHQIHPEALIHPISNPISNKLKIQRASGNQSLTLRLTALDGKMIEEHFLDVNEAARAWDLSHVASGYYLLFIENGQQAPQVFKLIKVE